MKKFFLFAGDDYYPGGGAFDCIGKYSLNQALKIWKALKEHNDWGHLADENMNIVRYLGEYSCSFINKNTIGRYF